MEETELSGGFRVNQSTGVKVGQTINDKQLVPEEHVIEDVEHILESVVISAPEEDGTEVHVEDKD